MKKRYLSLPIVLSSMLAIQLVIDNASVADDLPPGCQSDLIAKASGLLNSYSVRSGKYCDGTLPIPNKGELQVVSFTMGPVVFDAGQHFLLIKNENKDEPMDSISLTGGSKRLGGSYRLDGTVPGEGLRVDLDAAIHPQKLNKDDLGLLAWLDAMGERIYIPVSAGANEAEKNNAIIALRSPSAIIEASVQVCEHQTGGAGCSRPQILGNSISGGTVLEFLLPRKSQVQDLDITFTTVGPGHTISAEVFKVRVH